MPRPPVRDSKDGAIIDAWVIPGSTRPGIVGTHGERLRIRVAAPPEKGRANAEAIELLESALGGDVILVRGMTSRHKVFMVAGHDSTEVLEKLALGD